ncbi:MAG TPA: lytic transglycosylase domain-containing protein [Candidatus Sulfotelmatobacter sp.]
MKRSFSIRIWMRVIVLTALVSLPCLAADVAVLRNGFSIRHERREIVGESTRLFVSADGSSFVDVPTAEIEHIEAAAELPASGSGLAAVDPLPLHTAQDTLANNTKRGSLGVAPPLVNLDQANLNEVVTTASGRYRLDPDLVNSVIRAESGFNVHAVSRKGAQGLMQLMPGTASQLGVPNAFDAAANVDGGARYLRELLERYNFDMVKALAAYNAGTRRVEQYGGVPPYVETRAYVKRIVLDFNKKKLAEKAAEKCAAKAKKSSKQSSTSKQTSAKSVTLFSDTPHALPSRD